MESQSKKASKAPKKRNATQGKTNVSSDKISVINDKNAAKRSQEPFAKGFFVALPVCEVIFRILLSLKRLENAKKLVAEGVCK